MRGWDTVAIVGVGLIGGSIGLALKQRKLARQVVGIGRRQSSLRTAKKCGAVDSTTTEIAKGVANAEFVVVCTPVEQIVAYVRAVAEHGAEGVLITDAGSTKANIVSQLSGKLTNGARFVGSHPLAGSEKTGPQHAHADLYEGRTVVLTPGRSTNDGDRKNVERFWRSLGAKVVEMTPKAHDQAMASASHLPHLVSSALAAATPDLHLPMTASGWSDTTRIAGGDPELWRQIFTENRQPLLKALDNFAKVLASYRDALEDGNDRKTRQLLEKGKQKRDAVGS